LNPKILIFIDWFTPGFKAGGPIKSITNIINSLSDNFDFYIITSDRDINEESSYKNLKLNSWISKEKYSIIYLTPDTCNKWISDHINNTDYDKYYFNSLFSKNFTIKPLLTLNKLSKQNIIIAPRGMLGKGALSIKPFKKKIFLTISKILSYYKNVTWHATNEGEKNDIIAVFGYKSKIKTASNISICVIDEKRISKVKEELNLVFFSRISPKKNLIYVLNLLKEFNHISLDIYGSIEDKNYWKKCLKIIDSNKINAQYKGEINPIDVTTTLANYHFFILPTLHENYGHVIIEALTAGCGLIISNNTPWENLSEKHIGWEINLNDNAKFINTLRHCLSLEENEYDTIRNNCYKFVSEEINSITEIEDTKKLFT